MYEFDPTEPESEIESEIIGVKLVRKRVNSQTQLSFTSFISVNSQNAADIQSERYAGDCGGECLFHYCNNKPSWKKFIWEFFPGWRILSYEFM